MGHMPPHRCERSGLSPRLWKCRTQEGSLKPRKAVVPCSWEICPSSLCRNVHVPDKMRPLHPGGTPALGVAWKEGRSVFKEKGAYLQMPLWTRLCLHFLRSSEFYSWECRVVCPPSHTWEMSARACFLQQWWKLLTLLAEGLGSPQVQWSTVSCGKTHPKLLLKVPPFLSCKVSPTGKQRPRRLRRTMHLTCTVALFVLCGSLKT